MFNIENFINGFVIALQPHNLMWCFVGVFLGNLIGILPGIGALATISMLLPLTYNISPIASILMLSGIYYGAQYGGAITSVLLNVPGETTHTITCRDGHPLVKQGKANFILKMIIISSVIGTSFGILQMLLFAPLVASLAFKFGSHEIATLMIFGLVVSATIVKENFLKGLAMVIIGIFLSTIGTDLNTGEQRFTFGVLNLSEGIEITSLVLGIFGIVEFLKSINNVKINNFNSKINIKELFPKIKDIKEYFWPILRGSSIGGLFACIPGVGPIIASILTYSVEKKISKTPEKFGNGAVEGVVAPEAAIHSSVQGDFIPSLTLGIPGDAVLALILTALIIQGITPGPNFINDHPDIFWGLFASFFIGNIILLIFNIPLINIWIKILKLPYRYIYPLAILFICLGAYSNKNSMFDVYVTLFFGIFGYFLYILKFDVIPILIGFVLGSKLEENFIRSMAISNGNLLSFFEKPISIVFLVLTFVVILFTVFLQFKKYRPFV